MTKEMILPGATIGMIGGGQLGRMFVIAAKYLGYNVIVLEPGANSPAGQVADEQLVAAYDDPDALAEFAKRCDVITTEFENIPASVLEDLSKNCIVHPSAEALSKTQDRIIEKDNSGHYTIDACVTSQFEQQVRTVCNLPFGSTQLLSPIVMTNLLGDLWGGSQPDWNVVLASSASKLHLYGKDAAKPGRKMGHFCTLADSPEAAEAEATSIFNGLKKS